VRIFEQLVHAIILLSAQLFARIDIDDSTAKQLAELKGLLGKK
jgi:hypothetical protein